MANGIRTCNPRGFNKGRSSKFHEVKKTGGYISRNIMEITIKMKTIVRKPLMIKNIYQNKNIRSNPKSFISISDNKKYQKCMRVAIL